MTRAWRNTDGPISRKFTIIAAAWYWWMVSARPVRPEKIATIAGIITTDPPIPSSPPSTPAIRPVRINNPYARITMDRIKQ